MDSKRFTTVDEYIAAHSGAAKEAIVAMRKLVTQNAPGADEVISYNMPALKFNGILLYYAAHTNHLGFYPFTTAIRQYATELEKYDTSKGTVKFPFGKSLPSALIKKMVKFRMQENLEKEMARKAKRVTKKSAPKSSSKASPQKRKATKKT